MRPETCRSIGEMLVAFDDGELPSADIARVEAHLANCSACRRELSALRRSLALARADWQAAPLRQQVVRPVVVQASRSRYSWGVAAAAAMLAVALIGGSWWLMHGSSASLIALRRDGQQGKGTSVEQPEAIATVDRLLNDEALAAQLSASAALLTAQAGAEEYGHSAYRYLARTFPNTSAGREAAALVLQAREK
ncbi:MAG: zf-HC2 domain-containing protein [Planctomycetes bacterium]|nr:zf-HC2 domain-containing protein [Planctomycetota bacterium]